MVTAERIKTQIQRFEACVKRNERNYQDSGETSYLSVARRYAEQAEVYAIAYKALTQKKEKSYTID